MEIKDFMKQIYKGLLPFITVLFYSVSAYADCAGNALSIFPSGSTIKQNSIFVLEGYEHSQKVILGLNKEYPVYLKSGNQKIKLIITELNVGQFRLTQAVLKPETELEVGLEYRMYIDHLPEYESFNKYNTTTDKYEPVIYKVAADRDTEKPQLTTNPIEIDKSLVYYGCGPSIHVVFSNPAKDNSEIIVQTTVKDLKTRKETTYYIRPDGDKIKVGHGMCSGAFDFDDDSQNFEVEFSFMDASGNLTPWTGERIKFTKPKVQTKYDEE
jgi:hypothetical protein